MSTITIHVSDMRNMQSMVRGSRSVTSNVLACVSLWCGTFGVVVLAWAIQPEPVAIVVTSSFLLLVCCIVAWHFYGYASGAEMEER
ncbi:hypothetical protein BD410DRAFT_795810 [Rickenella mellea]|uniref:Uncharacterized protein n=1 Tax=Rickenella mellea TaxID=50990 RepID=A0A4Y7PKK0_9AGAM|nr:hypothetical protein BD410DRAFT_795810 [Rickenella mellea]